MLSTELASVLTSYNWTRKDGSFLAIKTPFEIEAIAVFQHSNYQHELRVYPGFWMHFSESGQIRGEGFTADELRDHLYGFHK